MQEMAHNDLINWGLQVILFGSTKKNLYLISIH